MKIKYLLLMLGVLIGIWISIIVVKDYQRRMQIHNAAYQCMYGQEEYCK